MYYKPLKHYVYRTIEKDIHVIPVNDFIVRICYGDLPSKNISDAVNYYYELDKITYQKGAVRLNECTVSVNEYGLASVCDKNGHLLVEDNRLGFNCTADEYSYEEQEYEVINQEKNIVYAYELRRKLKSNAGYYGMGEKFGYINWMGRNTENWNTDVLGVVPVHTSAQLAYHTSIPFYIEINPEVAVGIFHDTSYHNYFDFGKYRQEITIRAEGGAVDYYIILGPDVGDVISRYTQLTGRAPIPRRDFLGYQQCRWSYMSSQEVLEIANRFRSRGVPLDVIYLDIDYMQNYKIFTWNSKKFKDFKHMISKLNEMHVKLVVIIDPGVKYEKGYHAFDSGLKESFFIRDKDGEVYIGKVWPGKSVFPDFLQKKVRIWWKSLHEDLLNDGVQGIWNDMNEIADMTTKTSTVPEDAYHMLDDGTIIYQKEAHNLYGHYNTMATYEALKSLKPEVRPFVLTRAASAGTQRYSALWTGDNTSIWEHLEMSIPMLLNLSLSGFAFIGTDIGGFVGDGEAELLERWMQLGAFYPLCRNHSCMNSLRQEPWGFGMETEHIITKFINYRYSLISQIYQLFWEHSITGAPILRPLFYHYQDDSRTFNINDQFLVGDNILVAPIVKPKTYERLVYLPKGKWYSENARKWFDGGNSYIVAAKRDEIPVFIRSGSMVLRNKPHQFIDNDFEKTIELHIYHGENFEKTLYFDDGISFEYEKGAIGKLKVIVNSGKVLLEVQANGYPIPKIEVVEYNSIC